MKVRLLRSLRWSSTLATALSELTLFGRPNGMRVAPCGLVPLFVGNPEPSHEMGGPSVQPAILRLAGLGVMPAACIAAMASTTLLFGSPPSETVAGSDRVKPVARIQRRVAAKGVGGAVDVIGARLQCNVDDGTGLPAVFCRRILLNIEFLNGVDGKDGRRVSSDAGSVDDALAGERLAVEQTIDEVSIIFGAQAVAAGRGEAASRITHDARP